MRILIGICLLALLAPPVARGAAGDDEAEAEVLAWRAARDARLREPDGWVSLVGLHWLPAGRSTVGAAADNDIVLATGPERLGELELQAGEVTFCPIDGNATVDGERVDCARLASDAEERYSTVRFGTAHFYVIDREGRLALRVKDAEAPTLRAFPGMEYFPFDPAWRLEARFEPHEPGRVMAVPSVLGSVERIANPGQLVFLRDGREHRLEALRFEGDDELFLIFADRTNGKTTYGAGRFLYTPLPDVAGTVTLDFNRSYNPPCVFTPHSTCPLPPPENRLRLFVEAGEKRYAHEAH